MNRACWNCGTPLATDVIGNFCSTWCLDRHSSGPAPSDEERWPLLTDSGPFLPEDE